MQGNDLISLQPGYISPSAPEKLALLTAPPGDVHDETENNHKIPQSYLWPSSLSLPHPDLEAERSNWNINQTFTFFGSSSDDFDLINNRFYFSRDSWKTPTCQYANNKSDQTDKTLATFPYAMKNQRNAKNAPSRGHFVPKPLVGGRGLWVPWAGSLWHKRAGVATLWATHFITIWNKCFSWNVIFRFGMMRHRSMRGLWRTCDWVLRRIFPTGFNDFIKPSFNFSDCWQDLWQGSFRAADGEASGVQEPRDLGTTDRGASNAGILTVLSAELRINKTRVFLS